MIPPTTPPPTGQRRVPARALPAAPLDAAARFHATVMPQLREEGQRSIVILFDIADHTHQAWRKAAVGELAREAAPRRVNAVAGSPGASLEAVCAYLDTADGVTGHVLATDDAA